MCVSSKCGAKGSHVESVRKENVKQELCIRSLKNFFTQRQFSCGTRLNTSKVYRHQDCMQIAMQMKVTEKAARRIFNAHAVHTA